MKTSFQPKLIAGLGALILLTTAGFHMTGLEGFKVAVSEAESPFMKSAAPAIWTLMSLHMVFIACLSFSLSFYRSKAGAVVLIAFGLWLFVDALTIFLNVGLFMAIYMLAASGLCFIASGAMIRKAMRGNG